MLSIHSLFKKKKDTPKRYHIIHLDECGSTNDVMREKAHEEKDAGPATYKDGQRPLLVVSTEYQTKGRGQGTNTWESERGKNLLFSILCHPVWVPVAGQFVISEAVALAIRDTLATLAEGFTIKWPNDIYWNDKKICGILIENALGAGHIKYCIAGIGLNVNQEEFYSDAPNPVSLRQILGKDADREALLEDIAGRVSNNLDMLRNGNYAAIGSEYTSWLYRLHGFYPYRDAEGTFEAALVEVEDDGHLVLRDKADTIRRYAFKEVEFVIPKP